MKRIPLTQNKFALVDDGDFDYLNQWRWHVTSGGYAARCNPSRRGYRIYMHADIIGKSPTGMVNDHINRNRLDNRRENLRITTYSVNTMNRKDRTIKTSIYVGVSWYKRKKKYQAQAYINGKKKHFGYFKTEEGAAKAYNYQILTHNGGKYRINLLG